MSHGENDAFWKRPGLNVVDQIKRYKDVPVYLIGGWYDSWDLRTTMSYMALARAKRGPIKINPLRQPNVDIMMAMAMSGTPN